MQECNFLFNFNTPFLMETKDKELKREIVKAENDSYRERFQFVLTINDNIICQRYFKILGFQKNSIYSSEFLEVMNYCVYRIQQELNSKSRIFMWYTLNSPTKLTGFVRPEEMQEMTMDEFIQLKLNKDATYMTIPEDTKDKYTDTDELNPYDVTFKFSFLIDNKIAYERIWDGGVYPRYVRNGVDLTNSDAAYKHREPASLHFSLALLRAMNDGRVDMVYHIIRDICEVTSYRNENEYTLEYMR